MLHTAVPRQDVHIIPVINSPAVGVRLPSLEPMARQGHRKPGGHPKQVHAYEQLHWVGVFGVTPS